MLAVGENRRQLGDTHQINNKLPVGEVFWLIADDNPVTCSCTIAPITRRYSSAWIGLSMGGPRREITQLLGSLPRHVRLRRAGPAAITKCNNKKRFDPALCE
jgi:hypothetical protein